MNKRQYKKRETPSEWVSTSLIQCEAANKELANFLNIASIDLYDDDLNAIFGESDYLKKFLTECNEIKKQFQARKNIKILALRCSELIAQQWNTRQKLAQIYMME